MRIISLSSGSKGNCMYVEFKGKHILIDVGWNYKHLALSLQENVGITFDDISAILISHAHSDHVGALKVILNNHQDITVVTTTKIYANMSDKGIYANNLSLLDTTNYKSIHYFDLKHDSDCVGYILYGIDESFCFISDNGGYMKRDEMNGILYNHTYYSIESNYDETMQYLDTTRHEGLKRRVIGGYGHTSNVQAINNACEMVGDNTKKIIFTHLSSHCNTEELASNFHLNYISVWGKKTLFKDIEIKYAREMECVVLNE